MANDMLAAIRMVMFNRRSPSSVEITCVFRMTHVLSAVSGFRRDHFQWRHKIRSPKARLVPYQYARKTRLIKHRACVGFDEVRRAIQPPFPFQRWG